MNWIDAWVDARDRAKLRRLVARMRSKSVADEIRDTGAGRELMMKGVKHFHDQIMTEIAREMKGFARSVDLRRPDTAGNPIMAYKFTWYSTPENVQDFMRHREREEQKKAG